MSKVITIDLELNPVSKKIIQLGYVIGDLADGRIFLKQSIIIDPQEELQVIPEQGVHISDYTGITQERIDKEGVSLSHAYDLMCHDIKTHNPTTTCVQWGDGSEDNKGDHDTIRRELGMTWDQFIFRPRAWDVKSYFQIYRAFNRKSVAAGLGKAMETLGMEFEGRQHNALDDAYNTFRIFRELGMRMVKFDKIKGIYELT